LVSRFLTRVSPAPTLIRTFARFSDFYIRVGAIPTLGVFSPEIFGNIWATIRGWETSLRTRDCFAQSFSASPDSWSTFGQPCRGWEFGLPLSKFLRPLGQLWATGELTGDSGLTRDPPGSRSPLERSTIVPHDLQSRQPQLAQRFGLSHDVTRHTFISMLVAKFRSVGEAALQSGNSESIIRRHYLDLKTIAEAEHYFDIGPQRAA
jgi:hypothetical protein